ncbi:MAG: MoaD family protein [Thermosphaera sp.]
MAIEIRLFATLIDFAKTRRLVLDLDESTIEDLLNILDAKFPGFKAELEPGYIILVNGFNIEHLNGLKTKVKNGDVVSIFPPSGGG